LIKIGPVTPEIVRVTTAPFWTKQQKSAYPTEYLGNYQTDLFWFFSVGRCMYEDYTRSSAIAEGLRDARDALVIRNPATTKHLVATVTSTLTCYYVTSRQMQTSDA